MILAPPWTPPPVGAPVVVAQEQEFETLELRVTSATPRMAVVDRGTIDGLQKGDRVVFRPRDGGRYEGSVVRIGERAAVVELDDPAFAPAPGTKGDARIPRPRLAHVATPSVPAGETPKTTPDHPPWERKDDEWKDSEPLLAHIRPLHPEERDVRMSGRVYTIFDHIQSTDGDRTDDFARAGAAVLLENPFGGGGELHLDGEYNYRRTDVPDDDDEQRDRLRVDRLSYSWGGDRFSPERYEVGRFLQHDMPEFGVLDGGQWSHRLRGGDSLGASIGLVPDLGLEGEDGNDAQVSLYYRFVADQTEQLSLAGGYQKTFHHLDADRDLFVAKLLYLPVGGWNVTGTAWIDYYDGTDAAKGSGFEVTQAYLSAGKRFEGGSSLRVTYTHLAFPSNELDAFTPVTQEQLSDDHVERVAGLAREKFGDDVALVGRAGVWSDEDDEGIDADVGFEVEDALIDGSRFEAGGFRSDGRYSSSLGWRTAIGATTARGTWRLGYEFSLDRIDGFSANNDDIPEHRVRASWDVHTDSRWTVSAHADVTFYDQERSIQAGLFLQRSF